MLTISALTATASFVAQPPAGVASRSASLRGAVMSADVTRRDLMQQGAAAGVAAAAATTLPQAASAGFFDAPPITWQPVELPIATDAPILFDIDFDPANPQNGWIVGNKGTFLLTKDGGKSWQAKSFANLDPDEEINYRFTKMSWINGEGWIIGKPAILLHSKDSGEHPPCRRRRRRRRRHCRCRRCRSRRTAATALPNPPTPAQPPNLTRSTPLPPPPLSRPLPPGGSWERVPLSPKLPGDPFGIVALGSGATRLPRARLRDMGKPLPRYRSWRVPPWPSSGPCARAAPAPPSHPAPFFAAPVALRSP